MCAGSIFAVSCTNFRSYLLYPIAVKAWEENQKWKCLSHFFFRRDHSRSEWSWYQTEWSSCCRNTLVCFCHFFLGCVSNWSRAFFVEENGFFFFFSVLRNDGEKVTISPLGKRFEDSKTSYDWKFREKFLLIENFKDVSSCLATC